MRIASSRQAAALAAASLLALPVSAVGAGRPVVALYGLDPKSPLFAGKSPAGVAAAVAGWGYSAVFGGYDHLGLSAAMRDAGVKVYAELPCFAGLGHWKKRPESRPVNDRGRPIRKVRWYAGVCPNQAWLRKDLLDRGLRLAASGRVDGIWLDFIRYPGHWEVPEPELEETCFCPACLAAFEKATGLKPPRGKPAPPRARTPEARWILEEHRSEWTRFKCEAVASFARDFRAAVKAAAPGVTVGIFSVPWAEDERGGAVLSALGQDLRLLAPYADVVSPMAYYPMVRREPRWLAEAAADAARRTGKPVWPVMFAGDAEHPVPAADLARDLGLALGPPSEGVIVFDFGHLVRNKTLETMAGAVKALRGR